MTIIEKLIELGEALNTAPDDFTVLYADRSEQNLQDETLFPIMFIDPIKSDDGLPKTGIVIAKYPLSIFFGKKSEMDWTTIQHETECNAPMRNAARRFITAMQNDSFFRSVTSAQRQDVKNIFDVNISGCLLTVNVEIVDADSICV